MPPIRFDRLSLAEDRLRVEGYRQLDPFFVLREGVIKDERTGGVVKLDRHRLAKIAVIQNQRIADTGDFTPIIIGHTKKNKKENEQPELTGWASRFEVVPFMDTGTWGLRAVPWSRPEKVENFERYPRRSAELWTNPDLLDPISLLGANTPRLDLGLHRLQRGFGDYEPEYYTPKHDRSGSPIFLEMDMADDKDSPDSSADKPASDKGNGGGNGGGQNAAVTAVLNSPEFKQLQATVQKMADAIMPLLDEMQAGAGGGAPPPGAPPGAPPGVPGAGPVPGGPPAPEPGGLQQMSGHPAPPQYPSQYAGHPMSPSTPPCPSPTPARYNMGPAGGTNSMMPTQLAMTSAGHADPRDAMIADLQNRLARMEQNYSALHQQNAAMQLSMIEQTVNTALDDLEDKITFDRPREFGRLVRLSRAEFDAEIQYMLTNYKPVEQPVPPEGVPLGFQAGEHQVGKGPMGPVQLSLSQAHDALAMPPDPALANNKGRGAASVYDTLVDIVRNRTKGEGTQAAYERVMGKMQAQSNGAPSVRS